jgi:hypothetical protein
VLHFVFSAGPDSSVYGLPLAWLLASCHSNRAIVDEEISAAIAAAVASDEPATRLTALTLAVSLDVPLWGSWAGRGPDLSPDSPMTQFWRARTHENAVTYAEAIIAAAATDYPQLRYTVLDHSLIAIEQVLEMSGGLLPLVQPYRIEIFNTTYGSYLVNEFVNLAHGVGAPDYLAKLISHFTAVGRYLNDHPKPPWVAGRAEDWTDYQWGRSVDEDIQPPHLDSLAYLGAAAVLLISAESNKTRSSRNLGLPVRLDLFKDLDP